jgi:MFS family permease
MAEAQRRARRAGIAALGYFCLISGLYAVSFWLPTILKDNGVAGIVHIGLWTAVPYAFSLILMLVLSRRSNRRGERRLHSAIPALVSAVALTVAALAAQAFAVSMIAMVVATAAMWASYTVFWTIPSDYLADTAAAGGIALINSIGLLGGFFSPTLIGYVKEATGSTEIGLLSMAALLVLGGSLILITKLRKEMS